MSFKKVWFRIPILAVFACLLSPLWLPAIGAFLVIADPLQKADALVVLAGDENERIAYGAKLFRQGYAEWFVLTEMRLDKPNSEGVYSRVVKRKAIKQGVAEEHILIADRNVATTYEEAVGVRSFAVLRGFRSLLVITSPYHTRRARWIFNQVFRGTDIQLIFRPALNHDYQPETWWRSSEDRYFTVVEYLKLVAHLFGLYHLLNN